VEEKQQVGLVMSTDTKNKQNTELTLEGISCASCVGRIDKALSGVPGVVSVSVNFATRKANIEYLRGQVSSQDLIEVVGEAGYQARLSDPAGTVPTSDRREHEGPDFRKQAIVAAVLSLPVFLLEMGSHMIPAVHHWVSGTMGEGVSWGIQFLLTTAVLFGPGLVFFRTGLPALFKGSPNMNSLVALGSGSALGSFLEYPLGRLAFFSRLFSW
jgi:Cu+-exporting ATPase